jgi:hypothetical protein
LEAALYPFPIPDHQTSRIGRFIYRILLMVIADVVFFTLSDAVGFWMIPIILAVVLMEGGILWLFNQSVDWKECNFCSILMNYVSAMIGYFLPEKLGVAWYLWVIHSPEMRNDMLHSEHWFSFLLYILAAFFLGWMLSIIIELLTLWPLKKILGVPRIALPLIIGNTVSYVFLLCCYLFLVHPVQGCAGVC